MKLLLDTHTFLWWLSDHNSLSKNARTAIAAPGNEVFVSAVSAWEITTKFRIGKLAHAQLVAKDVSGYIETEGFVQLSISVVHAQMAGLLPGKLQDPFDRLLIAQATIERMTLVSIEREKTFGAYDVALLW